MNEKEMKKKERLVSIIMAVILSAAMGIIAAAMVRSGMSEEALKATPAAGMFISSIAESIVVGVIVVLVLPLGKWGRMLAARHGAFPPSMKFNLLNAIPLACGSCIIVSIVVSLISVLSARAHMPADQVPPVLAMWLPSWLKLLPVTLIVSYALSVIIAPFVIKAVGLGGPPKQQGPRPQ